MTTHVVAWADITDKPTTFPPTAHAASHARSEGDPIAPESIGAAPASALAFESLRTLKSFGSGSVDVAVVSDSTANDGSDWVRLWTQKWGNMHPASVRRTYRSAATGTWGTEIVYAEGDSGDAGIVVDDTFTRTGLIGGSTSDSGHVWSDSGGWSANGTHAVASDNGALSIELGSRDITTVADVDVTTTAESSTRTLRLSVGLGGDTIWPFLSINTSGVLTVGLYATLGGSSTALTSTQVVAGVADDTATAQSVRVETVVSIQNVTVTVTTGGQETVLTGTIPEANVATLGTRAGLIFTGSDQALGGYAVDRWQGWTPAADGGGDVPLLAVHNGSRGGASLSTFDATTRADLFGGITADVLILALGHNEGSSTPEAFTAAVAAWVDEWQAEHPGCTVLVSSQNPQYGTSTAAVHRDRQAALRKWAKGRGIDYVPAFEAFTAQPDGGASLVGADGIHPTTPPSGLTGDYGSVLWADTAVAALDG